ncbi:MAG: S8 family serine peptidase, partial [Gammaproteobacteria bacterium]
PLVGPAYRPPVVPMPLQGDSGDTHRPIVLALLDSGADASHPLLKKALGAFYFKPGTPGEDGQGKLLRSHGTAMLGIYARLALGEALTAAGIDLEPRSAEARFRIDATLIAQAGPETPAGRSALARNLAWLFAPNGAHPLPDLINYSQGNGPLCEDRAASLCIDQGWSGVARLIDRLIEELGIVFVKSAGNKRYADSVNMTVPADLYNGITVANMHAFDWDRCAPGAGRSGHKIYRSSSVAPRAGRRLLHLSAPGVRIATAGVNPAYCRRVCGSAGAPACSFCARLGRAGSAETGYTKENTGTSPSAAVVGAAVAELMAQGTRDPLAVKAVLINSADSWDSEASPHPKVRANGSGCSGDRAAAKHRPYPYGSHYDRTYGWGYLNFVQARMQAKWAVLGALPPAAEVCYRATLEPRDKVTLTWERRVGLCPHCGEDGWFRLSRLDLALFEASGDRLLLDEDLSHHVKDNVLQVSNGRGPEAKPRRRALIVRVASRDAEFDGAESEPFALASARALTRLTRCPASDSTLTQVIGQ